MIIQIDATKVAHTLAKQDVISVVLLTTGKTFTEDEIDNFIEGMKELRTSEEYKEEIRTLYQGRHDYYFEIITNAKL